MDLGIIITGVILTLVFVLPIMLIAKSSKSGDNQSLKVLNDLAAVNNCKISQFETSKHKIIGMDEDNLKVFFIRKNPDGIKEKVINLAEIKKCQVISSNKMIKHKEGSYKVIDRVELAFTYNDINRKNSILDCYNANYDNFIINGEFQLAEKWEKIINNILNKESQKIKKAFAS